MIEIDKCIKNRDIDKKYLCYTIKDETKKLEAEKQRDKLEIDKAKVAANAQVSSCLHPNLLICISLLFFF